MARFVSLLRLRPYFFFICAYFIDFLLILCYYSDLRVQAELVITHGFCHLMELFMRTPLISFLASLGMCNSGPVVPPIGDTDTDVPMDSGTVDTGLEFETDSFDTGLVLDSGYECPENGVTVAFMGPPVTNITLGYDKTLLSVCIQVDEDAIVEGLQMKLVTSAPTLVGVSGARIEDRSTHASLTGEEVLPNGVGNSHTYSFYDEFTAPSGGRPKCIDFVVDILGPFPVDTAFQAIMVMEGLDMEDACSGDDILLDDIVPSTNIVGRSQYL